MNVLKDWRIDRQILLDLNADSWERQRAQCFCISQAIFSVYPELFNEKILSWLGNSAQPSVAYLFEDFEFAKGESWANEIEIELEKPVVKLIQRLSKQTEDRVGIDELTEQLLALSDAKGKKNRGAFFTPPELSSYVVHQVSTEVKQHIHADGLAFIDKHSTIIDPAAGAGIFLFQAIHCIRENYVENKSWSKFVNERLLPNLIGCDLNLTSLFAAHFNVAIALHQTGYDFEKPLRLSLYLFDTLSDSIANCDPDPGIVSDYSSNIDSQSEIQSEDNSNFIQSEKELAWRSVREQSHAVVIGNPPFASLSKNNSQWITSLLKGGATNEFANYFEVEGVSIGERKTWLHDDYVKFIRFAHHQAELRSQSVVGLVSNVGFLDNITFRGMRYQLQSTFDRIKITDFGGDTRNRFSADDQNIFGIETGIATALFSKSEEQNQIENDEQTTIEYGKVRGTRKEKLDRLKKLNCRDGESDPSKHQFELTRVRFSNAKDYCFVPRDTDRANEYANGFPLDEIFLKSWSAPVTARDFFVIDFELATLEKRFMELIDLSIPDEVIRERYFSRTRSSRYQKGDTRGWKLTEVRKKLASSGQTVADFAIQCLYRPFDRRYILWTDQLIDWPRKGFREIFEMTNQVCLLARRQIPPGEENRFFYVTNTIPIDGCLRNDNRGNETAFPLFANPETPNFSESFVAFCESKWQHKTEADFLFHYIYGLLYAYPYRERFKESLQQGFPRVFICESHSVARRISAIGKQLCDLHLFTSSESNSSFSDEIADSKNFNDHELKKPFPIYKYGEVFIAKDTSSFTKIAPAVWNYKFGAHQVLEKYLKDRRGKTLSSATINTYTRIANVIEKTIEFESQLKQVFIDNGGWTSIFRSITDQLT